MSRTIARRLKNVSGVFSAVFGLIIGRFYHEHLLQSLKTPAEVKRVIVCLRCGTENPVNYRFCGNCGRRLAT
jgi:hypothetical protein